MHQPRRGGPLPPRSPRTSAPAAARCSPPACLLQTRCRDICSGSDGRACCWASAWTWQKSRSRLRTQHRPQPGPGSPAPAARPRPARAPRRPIQHKGRGERHATHARCIGALPHVPKEPGRPAPGSGAVNQCQHSWLSQGTAGPSSPRSKHGHQPRRCAPSSASASTDILKKMLPLGYGSDPAAGGGGGCTPSLPWHTRRARGLFLRAMATKQRRPLPALPPHKGRQRLIPQPGTESSSAHSAWPPLRQRHRCSLCSPAPPGSEAPRRVMVPASWRARAEPPQSGRALSFNLLP